MTTYQVPTLASLAAGGALGSIKAEYQLTGPDCDPVYDISMEGLTVVTCCRDHKVRLYKFKTNREPSEKEEEKQ